MLHFRDDYNEIVDLRAELEGLSQHPKKTYNFKVANSNQIYGPDGLLLETFQTTDAQIICDLLNKLDYSINRNSIPKEEPVFILRAQDKLSDQTLEYYSIALTEAGVESDNQKESEGLCGMAKQVRDTVMVAFKNWEKRKLPDTN